MEWGAEARRDYSGWLTVANRGEGGSEVVVHLSFGERSVEPEMQERVPEGRADACSAPRCCSSSGSGTSSTRMSPTPR